MKVTYTAREVAAELGISRQRVYKLAHTRNLGEWYHRTSAVVVFTLADIEVMRIRHVRGPGRGAQSRCTSTSGTAAAG